MKDLSEFDYDDIILLFQESFAYRVNYFYRAVEAHHDDETAKKELLQMQKYHEEFENLFFESSFWYCEYDYAGVARKYMKCCPALTTDDEVLLLPFHPSTPQHFDFKSVTLSQIPQ